MSVQSLNLTLTVHSFYILLAIADRPLHGYGIRDQIATDSGGKVIIAGGTLYPAINRLVKSGHIERIEPTFIDTQIKHVYRITPNGTRILKQEAKRFGTLYNHARFKLGEKIF